MTSGEKKRRKKTALFNHFAANLSLFYPQYSDIFGCPLCKRKFTDISELDLAHVWTDKLGGRLETLTCGNCNQTIGSAIESYETRRAEYVQAEKLRMRMSAEDVEGSIGIDFSVNSEGVYVLEVVPKANVSNSKAVAQVPRMFKGSSAIKLTWSERLHRWERARLTYLHFGFLYMFHNFGYQWALSEHAGQIREQLKNPDSTIYEPVIVELPNALAEGKEKEDILSFFVFVYESLEKGGFLIATPILPHVDNQRLAVWLPATSDKVALPLKESEFQGARVKPYGLEETHSNLNRSGAEQIINGVLDYFIRKERNRL